ncbi:recombinase family protein [Dermacoccus sp. 147Ba]|uniref:recombinase family protein n=1 Tax=Dermacoccus sp. 147Ba TaxID=2510111 RepID=UPI00101DDFE6|nr:recombinase family protein [Dermacoccus sp. 147Ba]RYI20625.1 recombinase family protein [Dermacoccus sp. 147Ba]
MPGQIVGYARVSSTSQNLARQLEALGDVERTFEDHQSGKNRAQRPGLEEALRYLRRGDTLRVASMDRLARSLIDLEQIVSELTAREVTVEFVKERLIFSPDAATDPFVTFQRQLIGAVAELERSLIRERQREGIELAKARGVYTGRARRLTDEQVKYVRAAAADGEPKSKIAAHLGVSRRLVYDVLAGNGAYAAPARTPRPALPAGEEIELPFDEPNQGPR